MMKMNAIRAALEIAIAGSAMPAAAAGSITSSTLLRAPSAAASRPPRRAGHGVRASQRRAIKARNVKRNRCAHR